MTSPSIEQMRNSISVMYLGAWADRVRKMSDTQVAAIYQRKLDRERKKNHTTLKEKTS